MFSIFRRKRRLYNRKDITFVKNEDYNIQKAYVLSNAREVVKKEKIIYMPIYYIMFFENGPKSNMIL